MIKQTTENSCPSQTEIGREVRSIQKEVSESTKKMRAYEPEREQKIKVRISVIVGSVTLLLVVSHCLSEQLRLMSILSIKQAWSK